MRNRFLQAIEGRETAKDKLFALLEVARHAPREEAFHGGCPVMNLAVESDDADPKLITCLIALCAASRSWSGVGGRASSGRLFLPNGVQPGLLLELETRAAMDVR